MSGASSSTVSSSTVSSSTVSSRARQLIRARLRRAGYTVIEVIMAMSVLALGATGIMAMQKAALVGNVNARNLAVANGIASTWVERLRQDSLQWVVDGGNVNTIANTTWLNAVGQDHPAVVAPEGVWFRPAAVQGDDISPQADVLGHDTFVDGEAAFCTHVRLTQLFDKTIRAEVRVFWLRWHGAGNEAGVGTIAGLPLCSDDAAYIAGVGAARHRYHSIYVTSGVIANRL